MTEQYLPCNINYSCGGDGGSGFSAETYGVSYPVQEGVTSYPVTEGAILESVSRRGDIDSMSHLDEHYDMVRFRVEVVSGGEMQVVGEDLSFPDRASLANYINGIVGNDGSGNANASVILRAYDVIDSSIRLQKVFGRNTAFSKLRSRYWGSRVFVEDTGADFPDRNNGLAMVYQELFGEAFPVNIDGWTAAELACFWMPSNRRRFYWGTGNFFGLSVTGDSGRFMVSGGAAVPVPLSPAQPTGFSNGGRRAYLVYSKQGTFLAVWGTTISIASAFTAVQNGYSVLYAAGMETASGERAVFLKPLGIDQIRSQYFDPEQYRLEAVGSFAKNSERRVRVLSPEDLPDVDRDLSGTFTIDQWINAAFPVMGKVSGTSISPGRVGFRLRNLETNTVSPISPAQIEWRFRRRGVPLGAIVVNGI